MKLRDSFLVLLLLCLLSVGNSQTITLVPNPGLVINPDNCMTLSVGAALDFERDPSCGPDVIISNDLGATALFTTSDLNFSFTFDEPGEYVVFCNSSVTSVAVPAFCINVPEVVPTISQWAVITIFLLLAIVAVTTIKELALGRRLLV